MCARRRCRLRGVDEAAVSLVSGMAGEQRWELLYASGELSRALEELSVVLGEGPAVSAAARNG